MVVLLSPSMRSLLTAYMFCCIQNHIHCLTHKTNIALPLTCSLQMLGQTVRHLVGMTGRGSLRKYLQQHTRGREECTCISLSLLLPFCF